VFTALYRSFPNNPEANISKLRRLFFLAKLSQCQDRMRDLEKQLENADQPDRVRFLEGTDPSPTELRSTIENVS